MSLEYSIDISKGRGLISGAGSANSSQFLELMNQIVRDRAFNPQFDVLADFTALSYSPSVLEVRKLGQVFRDTRQKFKGRVAFVVKDRVQLKLGRFASLLAGLIDFELSAFENMNQANSWLDIGKDGKMDKLKSRILGILGSFQLASLATVTKEGAPWARYVTVQATSDLKIRFATPRNSRKVAHILDNPRVHLTCGGGSLAGAQDWVQVEGTASICTDEKEKEEFWNDSLNAYFDGPGDPEYTVITIAPSRIEYMTMDSMSPLTLTL